MKRMIAAMAFAAATTACAPAAVTDEVLSAHENEAQAETGQARRMRFVAENGLRFPREFTDPEASVPVGVYRVSVGFPDGLTKKCLVSIGLFERLNDSLFSQRQTLVREIFSVTECEP